MHARRLQIHRVDLLRTRGPRKRIFWRYEEASSLGGHDSFLLGLHGLVAEPRGSRGKPIAAHNSYMVYADMQHVRASVAHISAQ